MYKTISIFFLALGLLVLPGCDGEMPGPDAEPTATQDDQTPAADTSNSPHRMNLEGVAIPQTAAEGSMGGTEFILESSTYTPATGTLRLQSSNGQEVFIFLLADWAKEPWGEQMQILLPPVGYPDANVTVIQQRDGNPSSQAYLTDFVLNVRFDAKPDADARSESSAQTQPSDSADTPDTAQAPATATADALGVPTTLELPPDLTGSIYLCLPDADRSYVAGTFEAMLQE